MIRALGRFFSKIAKRYLPESFIFAAILTVIVFLLGLLSTPKGGGSNGVLDMTAYWGKGFWKFLTFSMQMVMILITGSALANSKPVKKALSSIASMATTPATAIILTSFVASICCWFNWGFGLIVGALFAKEIAKKVRGVHYPLLVASAYSGFLLWHAGFSGSIPLKIAGADKILKEFAGGISIPTSQTIFYWQTLLMVVLLIAVLMLINYLMMPKNPAEIIEVDPKLFEDEEEEEVIARKDMTPAQKMENCVAISMLIGILGLGYVIYHFAKGGTIGLNIVNLIFLTLGIFLHVKPIRYVKAINDAIKSCGGIALQFPFYAGIMGMMIHSGLADAISRFFVSISTKHTFPLFTYISAGVVNFFVPSGGGQWGVQGPIVIKSATQLGVPLHKATMAIAWGDAWTNMVQPFWALPLLGVARLGIRDIMGYTTVILLVSGVVSAVMLLL